jgi:outer membrane protein TolC
VGKGWGNDSTAAREKAAQTNYQASLMQLRHTVASVILKILDAYWDLVAAQENFAVLENSVRLQARLLSLNKGLVDAGEKPRSDIARIRARSAEVMSELVQAALAVTQERLRMAEIVGLDVGSLQQAPRAADTFPASPQLSVLRALEKAGLTEKAIEQRADYRAALKRQKAARTLKRAARLDMKSRKDLLFSFFYQGYDENSSVNEALGDALVEDLTGPSFAIKFDMDLPFGNNAAKGKLRQVSALWRKSRIKAINLKRNIASEVVDAQRALQEAAERVQLAAETVKYYKETGSTTLESYKAGYLTLIDVITTDKRINDALKTLIEAHQSYAKALGRFRYATGALIDYDNDTPQINRDSLFTVPFLSLVPKEEQFVVRKIENREDLDSNPDIWASPANDAHTSEMKTDHKDNIVDVVALF